MLPTVGRVVHYEPHPGMSGPLPAIVTAVHDDGTVDLCAFSPMPMPCYRVPNADEPTPAHWNWPPRLSADPRPEVPSPTAVDGL